MFRYIILHIMYYAWKLVHFLTSNNDHQAGSLFIREKWTLFIFSVTVNFCPDHTHRSPLSREMSDQIWPSKGIFWRISLLQESSVLSVIMSNYTFSAVLDFPGYKTNIRNTHQKWSDVVILSSSNLQLEIKHHRSTALLTSRVWNSEMTIKWQLC